MTAATSGAPPPSAVVYAPVPELLTVNANRRWWDAEADAYQAEHGEFLGDADFRWCPEGLRESEARLLGAVSGLMVLEVGCGAGQCARWLVGQGARVVAVDLSSAQLRHARALDVRAGVPSARAPAGGRPSAPVARRCRGRRLFGLWRGAIRRGQRHRDA